MAVSTTIYPKQITWNGATWDSDDTGPLALSYDHESRTVETRTGDDEYSRTTFSVDKTLRVSVRLQEVKHVLSPGTKSDMTATLSTKAGTVSITFDDMIFESVSGSQERAADGSAELMFVHESDDGTTNPVT